MQLEYTIHRIIVIFTNIHMVTSGCQGGFIERNRSCRPKECQTQAASRPPQNCIDRNKREWDKCQLKITPKFTDSRGGREVVGGPISTVSMLSTGLAGASNEPFINISISYNKTFQDMDLVVNMTSVNGMPGDPYYYWLPDQRTVHLPVEKPHQTDKIMLSYRVFDTCSRNCTLHGCYLYVLHIIPMSLEHIALTYHITVFNITKNANLPELSLGWKSAIAVAVSPLEGAVYVVFEPLPSRLVIGKISYLIDLHTYPETYELVDPVQTYQILENATTYTHTFHDIKEGEYYVEVYCVRWPSNPSRNPWSRSQPFLVPPIFPRTEELQKNEDGVNKSHIFTSLIIVAALVLVIFSTICVFILHRKFPDEEKEEMPRHQLNRSLTFNTLTSGHRRITRETLIGETGNNHLDENENSSPQLEETSNATELVNKFESKLLDFNLD